MDSSLRTVTYDKGEIALYIVAQADSVSFGEGYPSAASDEYKRQVQRYKPRCLVEPLVSVGNNCHP